VEPFAAMGDDIVAPHRVEHVEDLLALPAETSL
jgi:hypothetical protein